jgi:cold shock CspA family protein
MTGRVKFYGRKTCYGFIVPDNTSSNHANDDDQDDSHSYDKGIYVHRNGIQSNLSASESPHHPYLLTGERVKFQVVQDMSPPPPTTTTTTAMTTMTTTPKTDLVHDDGGEPQQGGPPTASASSMVKHRPRAVNVVLENGEQVPLFRKK